MSEGDRVTLRATPLDQTSIQTGGRRRELAKSRLARRGFHTHRASHGAGGHSRRLPAGAKAKTAGSSGDQADRRRKSSLFRRLSNKRASAEIQQVISIFSVYLFTLGHVVVDVPVALKCRSIGAKGGER